MMTATQLALWYSPIGLASAAAGLVLGAKDLTVIVGPLLRYVLTVVAASLVHGLVTLPCLYYFLARRPLGPFAFHLMRSVTVALGTASRYKRLKGN